MRVKPYALRYRSDALPGLPWHKENREFGWFFFQTEKTQGIFQKISKTFFYRPHPKDAER